MTERAPAARDRALAVGLAGVAALIAVTCSSRGALERGPVALPVGNAQASGARGGVPSGGNSPAPSVDPGGGGLGAAGGVASAGEPHPTDPTRLELTHFFSDLRALEARQARASVRILWLGDSHTAADYLTGALRSRLQARFGAGGPGFLRIGVKPYRHSQVHFASDGAWKLEPSAPSRRTPFGDGLFGLGGLRAAPDSAPAQASFELSAGAATGRLNWQIWVSLRQGASFRVTLGGVSQGVTLGTPATEMPGAGFVSVPFESALTDKLEILTQSGSPQFFGVIAESSVPGLVLDAVGIDGARVATALAWNEASFEAAVRARAPSLVVMAFGTNEAFDADKVEKYRAQYEALLARSRAAAPNADCLLVGPPDGNAVAGGSEPRLVEIDALERSVAAQLGCGYVGQMDIMGGPGSYSRWAHQSPPLARGDRLHLSAKGYEVVADAIAVQLLSAYARDAH